MPAPLPPDEALALLKAGNARFAAGQCENPQEFLARAYETAQSGQNPIAVILSCSDSRVPLEIIFDQGLGDIFVIRIAGNICGWSEIGSIEFAVETTGVRLCVILGHTQCGAVTATVRGEEHNNHVGQLITTIEPAVRRVERLAEFSDGDFIDACCRENVLLQRESLLANSSVVRREIVAGNLRVVGAMYDIEQGSVTFLDDEKTEWKVEG